MTLQFPRAYIPALWALLVTVVVACASVGIEGPKTFNDKIAVSAATVTAVRQTATTLLTAGKITAADAANVQMQADNARAGIEVARLVGSPAGDTKLHQVQVVLQALQAYLAAKGK